MPEEMCWAAASATISQNLWPLQTDKLQRDAKLLAHQLFAVTDREQARAYKISLCLCDG
ncbi:hypothetical protein [Stutzerimonas xanthomarina]|uniref:hypothetical protein n=1 Tax=Stutzerimonas xanthomarina TaxID=271420 RepID=UPI0029C0E13F|nr:hypothetical protein [Stutzerimonas xanthomarina]